MSGTTVVATGTLVRPAAYLLAGALVVLAALHAYWMLGGTWALAEALGGEQVELSGALRLGAGVVAALLLLAGFGVLGRVGIWGAGLPWRLFSWGTWVLVGALVLVALANLTAATALERFVFAPLALALAALAAVVATSDRPA